MHEGMDHVLDGGGCREPWVRVSPGSHDGELEPSLWIAGDLVPQSPRRHHALLTVNNSDGGRFHVLV